ncbi:MAG: hypothetical protein FJ304_08420 [Planctomycetes bacterium]|nr:hypothetical protein [Planctomycetota bacterium]
MPSFLPTHIINFAEEPYFDAGFTWSGTARGILAEPLLHMDAAHADRMVWLDTFGDLIGNTDRHLGNFSFFAEEGRELALTPTPVYDMLPMVFAPAGAVVVERPFAPQGPNAANLHLWPEAAHRARVLGTPVRRGRAQPRFPADHRGLPRRARRAHRPARAPVRPWLGARGFDVS